MPLNQTRGDKTMTHLDKLTALARYFKAHPIQVLHKLIEAAYRDYVSPGASSVKND